MSIKKIRRSLPVLLTDQEKMSMGAEMGKESQEHAAARERKKEVVAQMTADVEMHRNQVERLGTILANGYEYRDVECAGSVNPITGKYTLVRLDTGDVVEERMARDDELQGELDL